MTRCKDCEHVFAKPSFSEGVKTVDQITKVMTRFEECSFLCPKCFSSNIGPDGDFLATVAFPQLKEMWDLETNLQQEHMAAQAYDDED